MDKYDNYIHLGLGAGSQSETKIKQFTQNYSGYFPADQHAAILDIGPGKGELLTCLSRKGYTNLTGTDISASVVEYISKLGFQAVQSDNLCEFLANKQDHYAMITLCDVVEHIPKNQILEIMTAVKSALKEDGILIVQVPNMQSITASIFLFDDFTHETGYTERSLTQMLKLAGFKSVDSHGFEFLDQSLRSGLQKGLRSLLWFVVRWSRKINGTMPHRVMHPIFFAVVRK